MKGRDIVVMGRISYLYWVGAEIWLFNELDAQVSEDGYYSFKDLDEKHVNYLKNKDFLM